jgi:ATP-dependent Lhr-like helicase
MIQFQQKNKELIREILLNTEPKHLVSYVEMSLSRSELFEWKFVHVAKRFGAFSRDAEFGKIRMKKIVEDFAGTPIFEETMKELETEKLDIKRATEVLQSIQNGNMQIVFKDGISPIGKIGLQHKYAEVVGPERPESEIFRLFKKRLMETRVRLICVNCGDWSQTFQVSEIQDSLKCGKCDSRLLASSNPKSIEDQKIAKKALERIPLTGEENKRWEILKKKAEVFMAYKKRGSIALAARGVGPVTAHRLLSKWYKDDDAFLRAILGAERQFVKTRQFWSA